jgi:hypothetical protein
VVADPDGQLVLSLPLGARRHPDGGEERSQWQLDLAATVGEAGRVLLGQAAEGVGRLDHERSPPAAGDLTELSCEVDVALLSRELRAKAG